MHYWAEFGIPYANGTFFAFNSRILFIRFKPSYYALDMIERISFLVKIIIHYGY